MGRSTWDFVEPLSGSTYQNFLTYSLAKAATFCVVQEVDSIPSASTTDFLARLEPWLIETDLVQEWPGSALWTVKIIFFAIDSTIMLQWWRRSYPRLLTYMRGRALRCSMIRIS